MDEKKIQEVLSDEAFVASLTDMDTAEEVQAALKNKGLEISSEDIVKVRELLVNKSDSDELSADELEDVAGGVAITAVVSAIAGIIGGIATGGGFIHRITRGRW